MNGRGMVFGLFPCRLFLCQCSGAGSGVGAGVLRWGEAADELAREDARPHRKGGQFRFTDPQATNSPQRFYRVRAN